MPDLDLARPPAGVKKELGALGAALDQTVPAKTAANLLIGTWNVRAFDRMTQAWRSKAGDSPIRDAGNVLAIAEVVRRFDVVAIQELRRTAGAFLAMMQVLGDDWAFVVTDVTDGSAGNNERLAFVFDTSRVQPSGLACELVVAPDTEMTEQFARTPYAVSFSRGTTRFTLVTLHVLYGKKAADRVPELTAIAKWLARWTASKDPWGENLIALGDFNIDRQGDPLHQAFTSTGLEAPAALNHIPRTIFEDPDAPPGTNHFYDQIAWFTTGRAVLSLPFANAGTFDFTSGLIQADSQSQLSYRISDHFPLWCEFTV